ncbi:hypothetical protein BDP27DRAFT_1326924 [Rhodocollybia butyracea]|uniref:Uncharacterized protein n=1 Tax=Rhodocollybia butyracea TaxID=206335 RepID=A0A9P5PSU9_9AGAR|nr:hypothetical protein BDP27DRAFT_1326924 [Rhodocollybia butyracea]
MNPSCSLKDYPCNLHPDSRIENGEEALFSVALLPETPRAENPELGLSLKPGPPRQCRSSDRSKASSSTVGQTFKTLGISYTTMALQDARVRLHEDKVILRTPALKLSVGKVGKPDRLGWRWFQCTKTLQILLPPDAGIQFSIFLRMEKKIIKLPSTHATILRYNNARNDFVDGCLDAKPNYPVRGISPSTVRYALEPGFKCTSIDEIVADNERICGTTLSMTTFEARLVRRSELGVLGPQNDLGCSWVRLTENTQVLLPADTTYQYYAFIQCSILSDPACSDWESALVNFYKICRDRARYLGIYQGDRLYILERNLSAPALDCIASILQIHYVQLAENAWSYALKCHTTNRTFKCPSYTHSLKRRRPAKYQPSLEPHIESPEDIISESDPDESESDESEWDSQSSLEFSVTTTILGSPSREYDLDVVGKDDSSSIRSKLNFFSFPTKVIERCWKKSK